MVVARKRYKGGSRLKKLCMARVLNFLIRYFSNYYALHRSDLAARAAPLDPRLSYIVNCLTINWGFQNLYLGVGKSSLPGTHAMMVNTIGPKKICLSAKPTSPTFVPKSSLPPIIRIFIF